MTKIILIDDSKFDLMMNEMVVKKVLKESCDGFMNPKEGYARIKEILNGSNEKIVLLLDLNMPELNGWELLELLKSETITNKENINVIIVSNSNNPSDKEKAKSYLLVRNYATKPLDATKFENILKELPEEILN